jgi:hypothetical protein
MKKVSILFAIFVFCISAFSHSASKVEVAFDNETKILTVSFAHSVGDNEKHFIHKVVVEVNEEEIINQKISKQESDKGGELQYKIIDLKSGDKVKVITKCNKNGTKSKTITIE